MACAQRKEGKRRVVKTRDFFFFLGKWGQCTARRFSFFLLSTYFYGKDKHVFPAREREVETIFHMIRRGQNCYFKCGYYAGKTRWGGPREKKRVFLKKWTSIWVTALLCSTFIYKNCHYLPRVPTEGQKWSPRARKKKFNPQFALLYTEGEPQRRAFSKQFYFRNRSPVREEMMRKMTLQISRVGCSKKFRDMDSSCVYFWESVHVLPIPERTVAQKNIHSPPLFLDRQKKPTWHKAWRRRRRRDVDSQIKKEEKEENPGFSHFQLAKYRRGRRVSRGLEFCLSVRRRPLKSPPPDGNGVLQ